MLRSRDKLDEKEDSLTVVSKDSTFFSSFRMGSSAPTIRVIGFRNFVPTFDVKVTEEEVKSIKDCRDFKELKVEEAPILIKLSKPETPRTIIEVSESGPFLIFTYADSIRNGHPRDLQSLETLQIDSSNQEQPSSEGLLFQEEDSFMTKIKEADCVYIISQEYFTKKMESYSIKEDSWQGIPVKRLRFKIESINRLLKEKGSIDENNLVRLGPVSKGVFGECYRTFSKKTRSYYGFKNIQIKSPEVLCMIFQEMDVIMKIIESNKDLTSLISLKLIEEEYQPLCLTAAFDIGLGTLEEFWSFMRQAQEELEEEELVKVTTELLRHYKSLGELKICLRDFRPSNIILSRDLKGFKFLDFSLSCFYQLNSSTNEVAGTPKYLAHEVFNGIKQFTIVKHDSSLADLYGIGLVIMYLALVGSGTKNKNRKDLLLESSKEIIQDKYPFLWEKYLCKLLDKDPSQRMGALKGFKISKEGLSFMRRKSVAFESFLVEKVFMGKEEALLDVETFLPYFWELKSLSLVDEMGKVIVEKLKMKETSLNRARRFFERLANLYEKEKNNHKVIETYERLSEILENEKNDKDTDQNDKEDYNPLILELHSKIGSLYKAQGNYNKALENYEKALYFEYLKDPEEFIYDFKNHIEIGEVYEELGHSDLALDTYTKVEERFRQSFQSHANHLQEAILAERIGRLHYKRNELLIAIEEIERAMSGYVVCYGKHHETVGNCEKLLGDVYIKFGDEEEAIRHYEIYFRNHLHGPNRYDMTSAKIMENMGDFYQHKKAYTKAIENYLRALNVYKYHDEENHLYRLYEKLAECYTIEKKYIVSVKILRLCLKIKINILGENSIELVPIIQKIANNLILDGEHKEALKEYSTALSIAMFNRANDDPIVTDILKKIGGISPLAFLAYKNYQKTSISGSLSRPSYQRKNKPLLISLNTIEDVRGVLGGLEFGILLHELREMISQECTYLKFFRYSFVREGKEVDILGEKLVKLEECVIMKDGFNHLLIREEKGAARERMTI